MAQDRKVDVQKAGKWKAIFRLKMLWMGVFAAGMASLQAQKMHIPDSVGLTDVQFFQDKEAGRRYLEAIKIPTERAEARENALAEAFAHARRHLDFAAQGLIGTEIAGQYLHQDNAAMTFDWVNRVLSIDSLIPPLSPLRQRMHRNLAGIYEDFEAHKLALPHHKTALAIDESRDPLSTPRRYRHSSSVAICFQKIGEMDSAFAYYQKSIAIVDLLGIPLYRSSARNNLGMALQSVGKLDSALTVFKAAYGILGLEREDEKEFAASVRDNWGSVLLEMGRPGEALPLFEENYADFVTRPQVGAHIQAGLNLVRTLVALGRGKEAAAQLEEVKAFFERHQLGSRDRYYPMLLKTSILVAETNGEWQLSSRLQDQLIHYQDSLRSHALRVKVSTLQDMLLDKSAHVDTEIGLTRQAAAEAGARSRIQTLLLLSAALLLVLLLILILINYRRRVERIQGRHQAETYRRELAELSLKNERLENTQLNQELEMKKRDITDYALVYSQRRKIFEEILDNLKQIKRSPNPEKGLQDLIITIKGKQDGEGKLNLEAKHIDRVNSAFFDKLKQGYPGLGASELELCGMIRLGYSAKDIAAIRNIAPASVRIAKTRLKKKLSLGPDASLEAFLSDQ